MDFRYNDNEGATIVALLYPEVVIGIGIYCDKKTVSLIHIHFLTYLANIYKQKVKVINNYFFLLIRH